MGNLLLTDVQSGGFCHFTEKRMMLYKWNYTCSASSGRMVSSFLSFVRVSDRAWACQDREN
jgi:hypothetical protein